jgi:hypothetical protein
MNDPGDLKEKIAEAKRRLPLPELMAREGLRDRAKKNAHCPFHDDAHKSFSVWQRDGSWFWKCHAGCGDGDEIMFLRKLKGLSMTGAMNLYLDLSGFPPGRPSKSHEYPKSLRSPKSPKSPEFLVYPVSNGQCLNGQTEKVLKALAARNACTERNTARSTRWQLVRDLRAVEKGIGRELRICELMPVFDEWYRLSQPFLDPAKTRDAYLAAFLKELRKVRVPTGEGDTLNKALGAVWELADSELPGIPGLPGAPEGWRRLLALHCELSRRSPRKNKTYFLSYRDGAKAHNRLTHQLAYDITLAFDRLGIVEIVDKGQARPNGGKASEFRYLLPPLPNGRDQKQ